MYVGFELNEYQPLRHVSSRETYDFKQQAKGRFDKLSEYMVGVFEGKQVIDAEQLADHLFPFKKADVFLSHSHLDGDRAIELAVALKDKGLEVFVDSCVWGYFNDLLKALCDVYADRESEDGRTLYDHRKSTDLTAAVHMMLNGALQAMIDRSELFLFLNTDNSIPLTNYAGMDRTFSPWLYSELQFSSNARIRVPPRKQILLDSVSIEKRLFKAIARTDVVFSYKAFNQHLPKVNGEDLKVWFRDTSERGERGLDSFYDYFNFPMSFNMLREKLEAQSV